MAQVERATSNAGKVYLTNKAVTFNDVEAKNIIVGGRDNSSGLIQVLNESGELNVNIDKSGIQLSNGATMVGKNGLLSSIYSKAYSYGWYMPNFPDSAINFFLGYNTEFFSSNWANYLRFDVYIPSDFTITEAYITLVHSPVYWDNGGDYAFWGYCRNVKAYKITNTSSSYFTAAYASSFGPTAAPTFTEISSAFGSSGYTAPTPASPYPASTTTSINIASSLTAGSNNLLAIKSSDAVPTFSANLVTNATACGIKTGIIDATLNIIGYTK